MRTALELPDDLMRRAKIRAVESGSTLRQLVIDALQREMSAAAPKRKRMVLQPVKLAADSPLRHLSLEQVKALDAEEVQAMDERQVHARRR